MVDLKPVSDKAAQSIGKFAEELNKVVSKIKGSNGEHYSKIRKAALNLKDDFESMGNELTVQDGTGRVYDLFDFTPAGHDRKGLVWQWKARE